MWRAGTVWVGCPEGRVDGEGVVEVGVVGVFGGVGEEPLGGCCLLTPRVIPGVLFISAGNALGEFTVDEGDRVAGEEDDGITSALGGRDFLKSLGALLYTVDEVLNLPGLVDADRVGVGARFLVFACCA